MEVLYAGKQMHAGGRGKDGPLHLSLPHFLSPAIQQMQPNGDGSIQRPLPLSSKYRTSREEKGIGQPNLLFSLAPPSWFSLLLWIQGCFGLHHVQLLLLLSPRGPELVHEFTGGAFALRSMMWKEPSHSTHRKQA